MRKTRKSKLLFTTAFRMCISLLNVGLIWILSLPTSDERDVKTGGWTDYVWCDYLDDMCSRDNNATTVILINDNCTTLISVKDDKHEHRSATPTNFSSFYLKAAEKFFIPFQFKRIMLKSEFNFGSF